jgi:hypothetical protein
VKHEKVGRLIEAAGFPGFYYQYPFHPARGWRLTFAWPKECIALEVLDRNRVNPQRLTEAVLDGWIVVLADSSMLTAGRIAFYLKRAFALRSKSATG